MACDEKEHHNTDNKACDKPCVKEIKLFSTTWSFYIVSLCVLLLSSLYMISKSQSYIHNITNNPGRPAVFRTYWAFGKNMKMGYLHNVFSVLETFGYKNDPNDTDWDLLWAHPYPFEVLQHKLRYLKPHQKVNHFPGSGYITNKVSLATSGLKYIPPAFKLPRDKVKFLNYIQEKPESTFVEKNNKHRNVIFRTEEELKKIDSNDSFVQEFVAKPLLVSGHKFDIGVYTIITSVDPLRLYIYNGDAILRFCPIKYYPFDPKILDKYVIADDYLPIWNVPSLEYYYNELGFGMKQSLNAYLISRGKDPTKIWNQIEDALRSTVLSKEREIINAMNKYKYRRNFFEMMRFDFLVDEDFNVHLLEANMSPNLSSAHFRPNTLIYQQVLYNMFSLVGIGHRFFNTRDHPSAEEEMIVSHKNIAVYPKECASVLCKESCISPICQLCKSCLSHDTREYLHDAFKEHLNRGDCKRIFPPSMTKKIISETELEEYSPENQLQFRWFIGKCLLDESWC